MHTEVVACALMSLRCFPVRQLMIAIEETLGVGGRTTA